MSDTGRGQRSWHFSGSGSALVSAPCEPGDELATWTHGELLAMDREFCARIERAFKTGDENRQAAAVTHGAISPRPR